MLNFPGDDIDITLENSDISCLNTQSLQGDEENDAAFFKQQHPDS